MAPVRRHIDSAMVKALALRWREMLGSGTHATIRHVVGVMLNASETLYHNAKGQRAVFPAD
jgi:hypothetical protein